MLPRISVIMSVYNAEKFLEESIKSILAQKDVLLELIIVNDGSTDRSLEIALKNSETDKRIHIINQANEGLPRALNNALKASTGEYIARMDADDIALDNRLKIQAEFLQKNPEIDIVGSFVHAFGDNKNRIWKFPISKEDCDVAMLFLNPLAHPAVMFRKSVVASVGYYNTTFEYDQDYEFWARSSAYHRIANIPRPLLKYRIHETQMGSVFSRSTRVKSQVRTQEFLLKEMGMNPSSDDMKIHLLLANAYRLEFDLTVDTEILEVAKIHIGKIIDANAVTKRYNHQALIKCCLMHFRSLCLYTANLGKVVYNQFMSLAKKYHVYKTDYTLWLSCLLRLGRKQHLVVYNKMNLLKSFISNA